ncbi:hypothetical protein [Jiulongibacter sp. NS-SX5]|uniref:hypothetical protein n=1 Tax=Jiulongibacter sp. NS-SX5 TaxID=3463854 RepID=UPI004058BD89
MTAKKVEVIIDKLFHGKQKIMAEELGVSANKISMILNKNQKLTVDSIGILLTKYRIDPDWLFLASDDEELRFMPDNKPDYSSKYTELLEEQVSLLKEKLESFQNKTASLKKSQNISSD